MAPVFDTDAIPVKTAQKPVRTRVDKGSLNTIELSTKPLMGVMNDSAVTVPAVCLLMR